MKRSLCAFLSLFATTTAWCAVDIGWIESINGNPQDVQIFRQGEKVAAAQYLPILEGDEIKVVNTGTTVILSFANGKTVNVDQAHSQIAKNSGQVPSVAGNLMGWIAGLGKKEPRAQTILTAASRGSHDASKLSIPLLQNDNFLVAGERPLALAWQGGKGPYAVKLIRRDNQAAAIAFTGITDTCLVSKINITPGIYELVLSDSAGAVWREKLIAVANRTLPTAPAEFDSFPPDLRGALRAAWLASTEDGQWTLETYTQLVTQPQQGEAESLVLQALMEGNGPREE